MAKKIGFLVNSDRCIGCHACEMACKSYYRLEPKVRWRRVYPLKEDAFGNASRMFLSLACNHCEEPQCLKVCPVKAYRHREDGIVLHDQKRCIGCQMCVMACPYRVPQYNEAKRKVEKCQLCYERLDRGEKPICVEGCPLEALELVDLGEGEPKGTVPELPGFPDPGITKPAVRFVKPRVPVQIRRDD